MFFYNSVLVVREGGKGRAEQEWMCFDAGAGGADMKMSGGSSAINGSGVENDGRVSNRITPSQHHIMRPPSSPFPPQPKREGIRQSNPNLSQTRRTKAQNWGSIHPIIPLLFDRTYCWGSSSVLFCKRNLKNLILEGRRKPRIQLRLPAKMGVMRNIRHGRNRPSR